MLKRWISGEELKKGLSITDADLMDYIITGDLQAYSENLEPFTKDEFREMTRGPYAYLTIEWPAAGFDGLWFKRIEVSAFLEKHGFPRLDRSAEKGEGTARKTDSGPKAVDKKNGAQVNEKIIDLIDDAMPEIDTLYSVIKKVGLQVDEGRLQTEVLEKFDDDPGGWKYVNRQMLENNSLFSLNPGKEKRDFEEKLMKKVVFQKTRTSIGGQRLRIAYKERKTD